MTVSLVIAVGGNVVRSIPSVPWAAGMNAQNALEQAYVAGSGYSFLLQYFGSSLGYEVMAFDGIPAQQGTDVSFYWEFIYNGYPAQQGIDGTILNDGDALLFSYVSYDVARHAGKRVEAVHNALRARRPVA
jgi:Domain of unknown function (DUF4430)